MKELLSQLAEKIAALGSKVNWEKAKLILNDESETFI